VSTDWENDFLFTCGSIRPARGLEDIIHAMSILKTQSINIRLVIAGETSPGVRKYRNGLKKVLASSGLTDSVCWTGKLNGEEIQWCYKKCRVFVMTSKVEACPNTALEAMSNGCVIISNDNSPMPEIFKDAAVYYSPKDSQSLAKMIESVFNWDSSQREKMARLAKNRASDFSWDVCAKKTVEELKKACIH
jgi:glycosyltransferase involved in cell wall biosynthesis